MILTFFILLSSGSGGFWFAEPELFHKNKTSPKSKFVAHLVEIFKIPSFGQINMTDSSYIYDYKDAPKLPVATANLKHLPNREGRIGD